MLMRWDEIKTLRFLLVLPIIWESLGGSRGFGHLSLGWMLLGGFVFM